MASVRKKSLIAVSAGALLALVAAPGCNSDGCLDNHSAIPLAALYSSETGNKASYSFIRIAGVDAPRDSAMATPGTAVSEVYLPMRSAKTSTAWCFSYKLPSIFEEGDPAYNDTLWIDYSSIPFFASEECGAMYNYRLRRIRHTDVLIDSVVVVPKDSTVTNVDATTFRIYFKTVDADDDNNVRPTLQ